MSDRVSSLSLRLRRTASSSVRIALTRFSTASSVSAVSVVTVTEIFCDTVTEDFTRILSYGPAILSTASLTAASSPSVASPAVPVTMTSTVPCPRGWLQSACANSTPETDSAASMKVSSVARCASSDHERSVRALALSSSSVSLPSRTIQSSALLNVTSPR